MGQNEIHSEGVLRQLADVIANPKTQCPNRNTECCPSRVHTGTNIVQYLHINIDSGSEYMLRKFADRDGDKANCKVLYLV